MTTYEEDRATSLIKKIAEKSISGLRQMVLLMKKRKNLLLIRKIP